MDMSLILKAFLGRMTWTMQICFWYSVTTCLLILGCLAFFGIGPRWEAHAHSDIQHAGIAVLLVVSLAVTEVCIVAGGASNSYVLTSISSCGSKQVEVTLPGKHDAWMTLLEYLSKIVAGSYMYFCSGGIMHADTLAYNGSRPVYLARFAQWSFAVPVLVLITNSAFIETSTTLIQRSSPSLFASFSYVWAAWLMEVSLSYSVRWPMMLLSLSGAAFVALDQYHLAVEYRSTRASTIKFGLLTYCKVSELLYAVVFLLGRFGMIQPSSEQIFYAYADATIKVFQGAFLAIIRGREGAFEICRWCNAAMAAGVDLENLLQQAQIPTLTIDLSGNILQWNDSISQLTGLQPESVQGKSLVDLSSADCREDLRKALDQRLSAFKLGLPYSDGERKMVELSLATNTSHDPTLPQVRKLAMTFAPKRSTAGDLEAITAIGQDLSEVAHLRMVQEQKEALLAMLGHEVRSPLHGMMGLTSALLENPASKPMHRQLGMIKNCSARLLDLVNNVMELAHGEAKKRAGIPEAAPATSVDFVRIAQEAVVMISNSVDKANKAVLKPGVILRHDAFGTQVPLVRGDTYKCTQLMYNLISNAAKFTDKGSITVSFRHSQQDKRLEVDVSDTGKGISEEGQKRIFQPFEQENSGDCRVHQGIGLGLAVCKEIADLHKGTLTVKSVVGQGSTFTFSLPCDGDLGYAEKPYENVGEDAAIDVKVSEMKEPKQTEQTEKPSATATKFVRNMSRTYRVLSVDDDEVNQEVIKKALGDLCEVACTMCGDETLKYLDNLRETGRAFPDLVLLDIQMPGMSGFEVCKHIRARYKVSPSELPVTMLSAKAPSDAAAIESYDSGSTDFVAKPFNPNVLRRKVNAAFKMKETSVPASSVVVSSEKNTLLKQHEAEEEVKRATEQTRTLEIELEAAKKRTADATAKCQALELKMASMKTSFDSETGRASNRLIRKVIQRLEERQTAAQASDAKPAEMATQSQQPMKSPPFSRPSDQSAASKRSASQKQVVASFCKSSDLANVASAAELLASRLDTCCRSAKQSKQLVEQIVFASRPWMPPVSETMRTGYDHEQLRYQLDNITVLAKMTICELSMMENASSNVGGMLSCVKTVQHSNTRDSLDVMPTYDTFDTLSSSSLD